MFSAFSACGRFSVTSVTAPRCSTRIVLYSAKSHSCRHPGLEPGPACLFGSQKKRRFPGQARDHETSGNGVHASVGGSGSKRTSSISSVRSEERRVGKE